MTSAGTQIEEDDEIDAMVCFLNAQVPYRRKDVFEGLGQGKGLPSPSDVPALKVELKLRPSYLSSMNSLVKMKH